MIRRFFLTLIASLLFTISVYAQNTNVSGAVTDGGGQTWNNGTYSFNFFPSPTWNGIYKQNGVTFNPVPINGSLSATGTFTNVPVPDNGQITPSGTKWTITVCAQTNFVCFTSLPITITGASQTITSSINPPTILVTCGPGVNAYADSEVSCGVGGQYYNLTSQVSRQCTVVTANVCTTWQAAGGGGITSVSSLPATCTPGVTSPVQLSVSQGANPPGQYNCTGTNIWNFVDLAAGATVDASSFGVLATTQFICDAGITNTSNVVTSPSTDRAWTAADVGKIMWAANAQCGGENSIVVPIMLIAQGTITGFTSAHSITVSNNATATCTVIASDDCVFVWGPDDSAAMQSAWTAAATACGSFHIPAGVILMQAPLVATGLTPCPAFVAGNGSPRGYDIYGEGMYATILMFSPSTTFANPNFTATFADGAGGIYQKIHDIGFESFSPAPAGANNKTGLSMSLIYNDFYNLFFLNYFPSASQAFVAITTSSCANCTAKLHDSIFENAGFKSVLIGGDQVKFYNNTIQNVVKCVDWSGGGTLYSTHNHLTLCGTQGAFTKTTASGDILYSTEDAFSAVGTSLPVVDFNGSTNGTYTFNNEVLRGDQTTGTTLNNVATNTVIFDGSKNLVNAASGTANAITNAGTLVLRNTALNSAGGAALSNSGTVLFKDGVTLTAGGITNTGTIQVVQGAGGYNGACTGVVTSATTVGLYNLGQTTATTCTSTTVANGQVMSRPGTVYALYCTATAGNQAADACTVVKNGAAQTMTCSLNGVTSCTDGTVAHQVTYVAGDILGIEVIAGTATTLANVKGILVAP